MRRHIHKAELLLQLSSTVCSSRRQLMAMGQLPPLTTKADPKLVWSWAGPCLMAETAVCQVDLGHCTGDRQVTPCQHFGTGMETWCEAGKTQWVHQRKNVVFPSGVNRVTGRETCARVGMQHSKGAWSLCSMPEMWYQGLSLPRASSCPPMSIALCGIDLKIPDLGASLNTLCCFRDVCRMCVWLEKD